MKKNIFKKIVASLATVAMAAGLFAVAPTEAKAADVGGDKNVYLVGSETTWEPGEAGPYAMTTSDGQTFTYELNITQAKKISFKLLVGEKTWAGERNAKDTSSMTLTNVGGNDNFTVDCGKTGKVTITAVFEGSTLKKVSAEGTAVAPLELPDEYYVVGEAKLCGTAWDADSFAGAKALTETSTGVWTVKFTNLAAGKYYYNVIQQKSFDNKLEDSSFDLEVKSDVTIKYTKSTKKVEVEITPLEKLPDNKTPDNKTPDNKTPDNKTPEVKNEVKVEVTLDPSLKWDEVYVHAWGDNFQTKWPGVKMTAKNGKYYATIDTKLTKLSYVISAGDGKEQTIDIADVTGQDVKITVTAKKDAKGEKFVATAAGKTVATNTGDVAPVVVMLVVAMAAASVVIASKKKTICE